MKYRINYQRVISQANSISDNAEQLSSQIKLLSQMEQECRSVWKGPAANVFLARLQELRNEMARTKGQMSNLSSNIKYCANRIQREDEEAQRKITMLKSGC